MISLSDSLRTRIRDLVASRQGMYQQVRAHREGGQVIPTSVADALNENAIHLREAIDRVRTGTYF